MPRRKNIPLPEEFAKQYPPAYMPRRIGNNLLAHTSPFEEYPGEILTPMSLDALDYDQWWKGAGNGQDDNDNRHWSFFEWETRFHIIKKWSLKNDELTNDVITKDPIKMPDTRLLNWIISVTQPIIAFSVSIPNWQGPLNDTTTK